MASGSRVKCRIELHRLECGGAGTGGWRLRDSGRCGRPWGGFPEAKALQPESWCCWCRRGVSGSPWGWEEAMEKLLKESEFYPKRSRVPRKDPGWTDRTSWPPDCANSLRSAPLGGTWFPWLQGMWAAALGASRGPTWKLGASTVDGGSRGHAPRTPPSPQRWPRAGLGLCLWLCCGALSAPRDRVPVPRATGMLTQGLQPPWEAHG